MNKTAENSLNRSDFQAILAWYEDMGVMTSCGESPIDWLAENQTIDQSILRNLRRSSTQTAIPAQKAPNPQPQSQNPQYQNNEQRANTASAILAENQANSQNPTEARVERAAPLSLPSLEKAKELASKCNSLDELHQTLSEFDGCGLKRTAKNLVFYRGQAQADLMIIGEAPGREEDIVGKPFVGAAGQLLDRMLQAININSNNAHITNLVYWRPPGNRAPTHEETTICRPFLDKQIELVSPKLIVLLGGEAAKQLYQTTMGITKLRGKWKKIPDSPHAMDTIATFHPAYLLRTPLAKRLVWQDLQTLRDKLAQ
jgi:DNA polymerase